jgi:hypothetical protein
VAEWYVLDMLEKSWDGFVVHTETGFNIGKPCYGYQADKVPHPVPAKRGKGIKKTFLQPDPDQSPVVQRIFTWRVTERLGYQAIADRLNTDPASNPAPVPVRPDTAVGHWTYSNVRDVLTNPKHTGHMVWNRHARKNGHNRANPVEQWVWSPQPVHEPLISMEQFIAAQEVSGHRFGSRSTHAANTGHRQTRRSYRLRTYLFCALCGRRMYGKTRRGHGYYVCAPKKGYLPDGHPGAGSFWIGEQALLTQLGEFLNQRVFGPDREPCSVTASTATTTPKPPPAPNASAHCTARSPTPKPRPGAWSATSNSSTNPTRTSSATSTPAAPNYAPTNFNSKPTSTSSKP